MSHHWLGTDSTLTMSRNHTKLLNMRYFLILLVILESLLLSTNALAKTLYISDKIYVPVRSGKGNQYEIVHRGLPTGTVLTSVEEDGLWTKITTAKGITGWVRSQYLTETLPARQQLESVNKRMVALENKLQLLRSENNTLERDYTVTQTQLEETREELDNIKTLSASAIESHQRLQSFAKEMQLLQTENDVLKAENEHLKRNERTTFFIYGAFTLLAGVLIAVIVPRLRPRKRSGWAS